jgi:alpha-1,2-mannosyltransferase
MPASARAAVRARAGLRTAARLVGLDHGFARRAGLLAGVAGCAALAIALFGRRPEFADLTAYRGALAWWADGGDLYQFAPPDSGPRYTHSPFAALVMLPATLVPAAVAGWSSVACSVAALMVVLVALVGRSAARYRWPRRYAVLLAVPLALALEPVRETIGLGQLTLVLFALVIADLVGLRRRATGATPRRYGSRWRAFWLGGGWVGAGIGLATAIKLTPVIFIGYLLLTKQRRAARTAIGTTLAATAVAFAVAWDESLAFFGGGLLRTDRVGAADLTVNQSLAGMLARLYDAPDMPALLWLAFSMLVLVVGLSRARTAHAEGDELAAFTLVGLTICVISPNSWTHQLVFVLPAILILVDGALRRRNASRPPARPYGPTPPVLGGVRQPPWFPHYTGLRHAAAALAVYLLFVVAPIWAFRHELPETSHYAGGALGVLMENSLTVATIVLVLALPWRPGAEPVLPPTPWARIRAYR